MTLQEQNRCPRSGRRFHFGNHGPPQDRDQRPRRNEIIVPNTPTTTKPRIRRPTGIRPARFASLVKVGIAWGGGGVNVGRRVGFAAGMKAAAKVGLMVGVDAGVGVGGTSTLGRSTPPVPLSDT